MPSQSIKKTLSKFPKSRYSSRSIELNNGIKNVEIAKIADTEKMIKDCLFHRFMTTSSNLIPMYVPRMHHAPVHSAY